jgi:hypothetical protein
VATATPAALAASLRGGKQHILPILVSLDYAP